MAVHERSLGRLYLAKVPTGPVRVPVHTAGITQMHPPWRVGRTTIVPIWRHVGLAIGWWKKTTDDIDDEFADVRWIDPKWLDRTSIEEIAEWDSSDAALVQEEQAQT